MAQRLIGTRVSRRTTTSLSASWEDAVTSFEVDLVARNLAKGTKLLYHEVLTGSRTKTFRAENGVALVSQFTGDLLRKFQAELLQAHAAVATVTAYHKTFKTFLHYCEREELGIDRSVFTVKAPVRELTEPETFTEVECAKLLRASTGRDRVIVELLLRTGLRREELVDLTVDDVIIPATGGAYLRVHGKMGKDRYVPLDTAQHKMSPILRKYIISTRVLRGEQRALFLNRLGRPLAPEAIKAMLQRLGDELGIHCHAHKFRHTFATQALGDGVDPLTLQRVLGHANLAMVSRYVHFNAVSLTAAWAKRGAA